MARIPSGRATARDRLVGAERILFAQAGGAERADRPGARAGVARRPRGAGAVRVRGRDAVGVPADDVAWLLERLFTLLASCDERRVEQWDLAELVGVRAGRRRRRRSARYLADGLTRTLVAARAQEMSARTGGLILVQLLLDLSRAGARADRVLDAPTSDGVDRPVGRAPALARRRGAAGGARRGLQLRDGRIAGGDVAGHAVPADYYVAALPVEIMRGLLSPELRAAEPRLNGLDRLVTRWMNGVLFYLDDDVPLVARPRDLPRLRVGADLDLAAPVLARRGLRRLGDGRSGHAVDRHLGMAAPRARDRQGRGAVHAARRSAPRSGRSSATISTTRWTASRSSPGSSTRRSSSRTRRARPTPSRCWSTPRARGRTGRTRRPRIPNLVLAADYVRTYTDLATMEGANEAARRAVNAILDATRLARAALRRLAAARAAGAGAGAHAGPGPLAAAPAPSAEVAAARSTADGGAGADRARSAARDARRLARWRAHAPLAGVRQGAGVRRRARGPPSARPPRARSSPNASTGPSAPAPSTTGCCAAQARKRRREVVAVDAREVDLASSVRPRRRRPRRRSRSARPASCRAPGRRPAPSARSPANRIAGARQRDARHERADERPGLQRPRQRPEPAEVHVDLAQAAGTRPAGRSARRRRREIASRGLPATLEGAHPLRRRARRARARRGTRSSSPSVTPDQRLARARATATYGPPPSA